jgi:hypothetical protein
MGNRRSPHDTAFGLKARTVDVATDGKSNLKLSRKSEFRHGRKGSLLIHSDRSFKDSGWGSKQCNRASVGDRRSLSKQ